VTEFLIITGLILLNGFFVAAEFAIVGAPRAAIDRRAAAGNALALTVQRVLRDPQRQDRYIATAQLGITVASLGLGMYGEHVLAEEIYHLLGLSGAPAWIVSHGLASVTAVAILTYFHIVVGEMVPKSLALQYSERTTVPAMRCSGSSASTARSRTRSSTTRPRSWRSSSRKARNWARCAGTRGTCSRNSSSSAI
jgi:CBS domain containing-hemolysin-like protein